MTRGARRRLGPVLVALASAAALTCAAAPVATADASGANRKACKVLTKAQVRRVVEAPVHRSSQEQRTPKRASICNWDVGDDAGDLVSVWVQRGRQAQEGFDVSERVFGLGGEPLAALGDRAFWSSEAGAVYVIRGSEFLYVQRLDPGGSTPSARLREQAIELADRALDRL